MTPHEKIVRDAERENKWPGLYNYEMARLERSERRICCLVVLAFVVFVLGLWW
jgi:hypothetical protein